jgi:hypothetical protein
MTTPTFTSYQRDVNGNNAVIYTWAGLALGGVGDAISGPSYADRAFQCTGSFSGGASVVIEGSNDGANFFVLVDPFDNPIVFNSGNLIQVTQIALWIRPRVQGGDVSTNLTVIAVVASHQPSFS